MTRLSWLMLETGRTARAEHAEALAQRISTGHGSQIEINVWMKRGFAPHVMCSWLTNIKRRRSQHRRILMRNKVQGFDPTGILQKRGTLAGRCILVLALKTRWIQIRTSQHPPAYRYILMLDWIPELATIWSRIMEERMTYTLSARYGRTPLLGLTSRALLGV
jgi:hypothetical protein